MNVETPRLRRTPFQKTPFNRTLRKVQGSILGEKTNIPGTPMNLKTPFNSFLKTDKNLALTQVYKTNQNTKKSIKSKKLLVFKDQDSSEEEVEYCPPCQTLIRIYILISIFTI
jgi:hypothetical protein